MSLALLLWQKQRRQHHLQLTQKENNLLLNQQNLPQKQLWQLKVMINKIPLQKLKGKTDVQPVVKKLASQVRVLKILLVKERVLHANGSRQIG
jgi:hypothetical protein